MRDNRCVTAPLRDHEPVDAAAYAYNDTPTVIARANRRQRLRHFRRASVAR